MSSTSEIPDAIARYLDLATGSDFEALSECFTEDAVVEDDGATMRGRDAIRQWRKELAATVDYTATVEACEPIDAGGYRVTATVAGDFPGSPIDLQYRFTLDNGSISLLQIAP